MKLSFSDFMKESSQSGGPKSTRKRSKAEEMSIANMATLYKKLKFRDWTIDPTIHAAAQSYDRRPGFSLDDWKGLHLKMMDYILAMKPEVSGDYIFYSKSMEQAYVAAVDFRRKYIRIVTVLPKGRKNPQPGTKQVIVEGIAFDIIDTIELD